MSLDLRIILSVISIIFLYREISAMLPITIIMPNDITISRTDFSGILDIIKPKGIRGPKKATNKNSFI